MKQLMNDKRGFAITGTVILLVVAVIAVIAILAAFMFSGTLRYTIIGVGILVGTFLVALPAVLKSDVTRAKIAIIVLLIAVGALFIVVPNVMQASFGGSFVKPQWGRMECSAEDTFSRTNVDISKDWDSNWVDCGADELTEWCDILLDADGGHWYDASKVRVKYRECDIGGSCSGENSITITKGTDDELIKRIRSGKTLQLVVEDAFWGWNYNTEVVKEFYRFKLYEHYGGAKRVLNSAGCNIPTSKVKDNLLEGEKSIEERDSCSSGNLEKGDWCNYVYDWVYGPAYNVFEHDTHGEVYCTGGAIYDIVELETEDGDIKKLDPTYDSTKQDGERLRGLGSFLQNVECCPSQPNCNDDFEWDTGSGTSCFSDAQCANGGAWYYHSSKQVIRESCEEGYCELQSPVTVACARDSDCGNGQVCQKVGEISNWKCVMGTGEDPDPDEDPDACAALAAKYPFMGYTFVETQTESCGWNPLCHVGIMNPKVTTETECKAAYLPYYIIGGIVLLTGTILVLLLIPKKKKKGGKKKKK